MYSTKIIVRLCLALLLWVATIAARFHFRAEPGQSLWFLWVGAQFCCAAGFGYQLGIVQFMPQAGSRRMSRMDRRLARRRADDPRVQ